MHESWLKDKKVHYVYRCDDGIYGVPSFEKYLLLVEPGYTPEGVENNICIDIQTWFKMIENCELLPWKCACLNKKFVIKEPVKLLMTTDVVKLYDNIIKRMPNEDASADEYWHYYNDLILTNQICEFHKIKKFGLGAKLYGQLTSYLLFKGAIEPHLKELRGRGEDQSTYAQKKRLEARIKAGTLKPKET